MVSQTETRGRLGPRPLRGATASACSYLLGNATKQHDCTEV